METYLLLIVIVVLSIVQVATLVSTILANQQIKAAGTNRFTPPDGMSPPEAGYWGLATFAKNSAEPSFPPLFKNFIWASVVVDAAINKYISLTVNEDQSKFYYTMDSLKRQVGEGKFDKVYDALAYKCPIDTKNLHYEKALREIEAMAMNVLSSPIIQEKYLRKGQDPMVFNAAVSFLLWASSIWGVFRFDGGTILLCLFASLLAIASFIIQWRDRSAFTKEGRIMISQVQGFKKYLGARGAARNKFVNQPEMTFKLYEKYLPYAVGLDVNLNWYFALKEGMDTKASITKSTINFANHRILTVANYPQEALHLISYGKLYQTPVHVSTSDSHSHNQSHSKSHRRHVGGGTVINDVDDDMDDDGDDFDISDSGSDYSSDYSSDYGSDYSSDSSDYSAGSSSSDYSSYDSGGSSDYGDDS